jgi:hypothetical protein
VDIKIFNQMKNYKLLLLALLSATLFMSCGDDDEEENGNQVSDNAVTFMGTSYELGWGFIEDFGEFTEGFRNYDFLLFEKNEPNLDAEVFLSNHAMYLWMESAGADTFTAGRYVFGATTGNYIEEAEFFFFDNETGYEAISGEVNVSFTGNVFTLDIDLTMENNQKLVGRFSGPLEIFDQLINTQMRGDIKMKSKMH